MNVSAINQNVHSVRFGDGDWAKEKVGTSEAPKKVPHRYGNPGCDWDSFEPSWDVEDKPKLSQKQRIANLEEQVAWLTDRVKLLLS